MKEIKSTIKSHIYPKFILNNWLNNCLENCVKTLTIYEVDLTKGTLNPTVLNTKKKISFYLENKNRFYFNLDKKYIEPYENMWGQIENDFAKLYHEIRKNMFDKNIKSIKKRFNKICDDPIKFKKLTDFIKLSLFRCELYRPISKIIEFKNDKINVYLSDMSELINNVNLLIDNNWNKNYEDFCQKFNISDYNFYWLANVGTVLFCNPPIFNNQSLFFIFPILGLGFIYFIKKITE